jgi:hypothetical protein
MAHQLKTGLLKLAESAGRADWKVLSALCRTNILLMVYSTGINLLYEKQPVGFDSCTN